MAYKKAFASALSRTLDDARNTFARAIRMDVVAPTGEEHDSLLLYGLRSRQDLGEMALGCDGDVGGLSSVKLDLDPEEGKGRFFGTLSTELPRGAKMDRSGYAGTRNKARPTLFGTQVWDTSEHPFIRLRVRDRLARTPLPQTQSTSSLRSALSTGFTRETSVKVRAMHALGFNLPNQAGPKFFVNIQTDGPVVTDIFQHRLFLDESKGNAWQDVIIPLDDFVLVNSGYVSPIQIGMMRQAVRTVGISAILEPTQMDLLEEEDGRAKGNADQQDTSRPPAALRREGQHNEAVDAAEAMALRKSATGGAASNRATVSARGSRRGVSYNYDLGIDSITVLNANALGID